MVCCCTSMPTTASFTALVRLLSLPVCRLTFLSYWTAYQTAWMRSNRLQLNAEKTEVMWCVSARRQSLLPRCPITVTGASVEPLSVVHDLGVYIDGDLGAATHVYRTLLRCFAALRQLRHLRYHVTNDCCRSLVVSLVHSILIMATSCLSDFLPIFNDVCRPYSTPQLAWYFNFIVTTTCLMPSQFCTDCVCHNGSTLNGSHGMPSVEPYGMVPPYLIQLVPISSLPGRRRLWSSFTLQLQILQYRLSTAGRHSFPVAASIFWNTLPDDVQSAPSVSSFQQQLKTFVFHQSFPDIII